MKSDILKVLILEDLKTDQELAKRALNKFRPKNTIVIADNRKHFFEKIEWFLPDLVLADYNLPDFNGLEALLYIKENLPDIPFVFLTSTLNNEEYVAQTILQGASGFVSKHNISELPEVLEKVMAANRNKIEKAKALDQKKKRKEMLLSKLAAKLEGLEESNMQKELLDIIKEIQGL